MRPRVTLRFSLSLVLFIFAERSFAMSAWVAQARRLSGESESVRSAAIDQLKKTEGLEGMLRETLRSPSSPDHAFALDVISTLKMKSLWRELLNFSAKDATGMSYLSIFTLMDERNHQQAKTLFLQRLQDPKTASVPRMVILDAFIRMNQPISTVLLKSLLNDHRSPEVRSAALYYVRGMTLRNHEPRYLPLLKELDKPSIQLEEQKRFFEAELAQDGES